MFSEEEILNAIRNPSDGIKSGHEGVEIELADGESVLGRVLRSNDESVVVLQSGNMERSILRSQILTNRMLMTSLMPVGLLDSCSASDVDDLLCYLKVRRAGVWERWQRNAEDRFRNWRFYTSRRDKLLTLAALTFGVILLTGIAGMLIRRMRVRARSSAL
jgi:putative heme-binding domain-containing protein